MDVSQSQAKAFPHQLRDEELADSFEDAATCVQTAVSSGVRLDQNEMLEVYGLYKQATEGSCTSFRPSFLRMKERAKWWGQPFLQPYRNVCIYSREKSIV